MTQERGGCRNGNKSQHRGSAAPPLPQDRELAVGRDCAVGLPAHMEPSNHTWTSAGTLRPSPSTEHGKKEALRTC